MSALPKILAASFGAFASIVVLTVASSLVLIFAGFRNGASFPVDCALVFGAAIGPGNSASPAIMRRVAGAVELLREGDVDTLVFTGGKGDAWRLSEAAIMRKEAIRYGADPRAILIEDKARSTKENLERSRPIVDEHCDSVVAVSDRYHMARIRLLAKKAGWGTLPTYGVPERPARGESRSVARELAAYVYYALGADAFLRIDEYDDVVEPLTGSGA